MKSQSTGASFESLRKQAKRWLKQLRGGDAEARERLERALPARSPTPGLREIQHALAREHGFESWAALKTHHEETASTPSQPAELVNQFLKLACLSYSNEDWPGGPHVDPSKGKWSGAERLRARHPELSTLDFGAAVVCGELEHVARRLKAQPELATAPTGPQGWEPLLLLCYSRLPYAPAAEHALAMAKLLLDHGADPNAHWLWEGEKEYRFTSLTGAIGQGERGEPEHPRGEELAQLLLERGADPNNSQALYNTHQEGDDTRWLVFLGRHGFSSKPEHQKNLSYLAAQASNNGHLARLRWLLEHGADPNARSIYNQKTCYELALMNGHREASELLLEHGAEPVALEGRDAFLAAVGSGDVEQARSLLEGHPEYVESSDPLIDAAQKGRLERVRLLLELGMSPNREGKHGHRALNVGCRHRAIVDLLLEHGADPRARCFGGTACRWVCNARDFETARHLAEKSRELFDALVSGHVALVRELISADPDALKARTEWGDTALHQLPESLELAEPLLELLLAHGADPRAKNAAGKTPLEAYAEQGQQGLADLLELSLEARAG